jgi:hypothetical protein
VHARVDERVAGGAFEQVGVDASEGEWQRKRDTPDARRDDRRVQRAGSFMKLITDRMVISRPVRLEA